MIRCLKTTVKWPNGSKGFWIGGFVRKGGWQWLNGNPWSYQRWKSENITTKEGRCVKVYRGQKNFGKWGSDDCGEEKKYLCEFDSEKRCTIQQ